MTVLEAYVAQLVLAYQNLVNEMPGSNQSYNQKQLDKLWWSIEELKELTENPVRANEQIT